MKNAMTILYGELTLCIVMIFVVITEGPDAVIKALNYGLFFVRSIFGA